MENEDKILSSWEIVSRRLEEKDDNASEDPSEGAMTGLAAFSGCLHPYVIVALLLLCLLGRSVVTAWDTEIAPALSELTRVEAENTDPREGEVRVNNRTLKECDGTTLVWTVATSLLTSDTKIEPRSPECQADPP